MQKMMMVHPALWFAVLLPVLTMTSTVATPRPTGNVTEENTVAVNISTPASTTPTTNESEPVPSDDKYIEVGSTGGGSMPARAAEGDYSSYTVAGAQVAGNQDYEEMDNMAGAQTAGNSGAAPLDPEQAYADNSGADPSEYAEASMYVSPNAATYGAPVHAANNDL
jgi:hypothetical protein